MDWMCGLGASGRRVFCTGDCKKGRAGRDTTGTWKLSMGLSFSTERGDGGLSGSRKTSEYPVPGYCFKRCDGA